LNVVKLLLLALLSFGAHAVEITIGENAADDFAGFEETELHPGDGNKVNNNGFEIGKFGSGDHRHLIVEVTVPSLSLPITVNSASIEMYATNVTSAAMTIAARRVLRNVVMSQVDWDIYSTGNNWTTGGGLGAGTDRNSTPYATSGVLDGGGYEVIPLSAADIQTEINAGATRLLIHLERADGADDGTFSQWRSSEDALTNERPFFRLDYDEGAPSSGLLLRRRRN
jgi:hypothetical protein